MTRGGMPPGWPKEVPPPAVDGWQGKATGWLLDQCPGEYRGYPVLRRHPRLLCWLTGQLVEAQVEAARSAYSQVRRDLGAGLGPEVVAEALATLEQEGARLLAVQRSVRLVADALSRS